MKKIIVFAVVFITAAYAGGLNIFKAEKAEVSANHTDSKDTTWNTYTVGTSGYLWNPIKKERATFYDIGDFGSSYPAVVHGVSVYCTAADTNYTFSYKIYDKDGVTMLWQSDPVVSVGGDNDVFLDAPIMVTDDFWVSVVPNSSGYPRVFSGMELGTDPDSTNTYLKQLDGSWSPMTDGTDYYEMFASVQLSPYSGTDTFAPTMRDISGTVVFRDRDMDLTITVHEQNSVISPMQAQYNIGAGWVDFEMTQMVKDAFTFTGTVPAQVGNTAGQVKFLLADDQGNSAWSSEYPIFWSKDIPMFEENFESGVFPPDGWTLQTTGAGFIQVDLSTSFPDVGIYEGLYAAAHMDDTGAQDDWFITPPIQLPAEKSCTYSYRENAYFVEFVTMCEVCVSTDMVNWTQVYVPPFNPDPEFWYLTEGVWNEVKFSLEAWAGETVYIGYHYAGDYSNQWYFDDIKMFFDYQGPQITSVTGNTALVPEIGAYLNNPMEIKLDLYDYTGIKSVTGHYSFDGGSTVDDAVFSNSKFEETWTGSVPSSSTEKAGYIYFTLEDNGGVTEESVQYSIKFVPDAAAPIITDYTYGAPVFVNNDITASVTFADESDISSVLGYFSKDGWDSQSPIVMNPSKIHPYTYTGIIPAETVETFAEVKFIITDSQSNVLNSDPYEVRWLDGYELFYDDFDGSNPVETWYLESSWGYVNNDSHSPTSSLHDSPAGNYINNLNVSAVTKEYDFSAVYGATLSFWAKVDLETDWDYTYLEATKDGSTWVKIHTFNGEGGSWEFYSIDLGAFALEPSVTLRFRLKTDTNTVFDGMYIDDVSLALYSKDYSRPLIVYEGPEIITATDYILPREFTIPVGLGDYKFNVGLTDISDISVVKIVYTVDGGAELEAMPPVSSGISGIYEMTIPAQPAGSKVKYRIIATDNSPYKNTAETRDYSIRFGNYLYYQNGDDYSDYLDVIGTSSNASAQAVAQRITMGPMDTGDIYRADLVGITIDNYIHEDWPSDPMFVHVWADDGGRPGNDLIEPVFTELGCTLQTNYEITYVDLRAYSDDLSNIEGDVYVGYTTAGTKTNILYEVAATHASVPGYVAFQRSWLGTGDESELSWAPAPEDVYHISAVTGEYVYVGIDSDENMPVTTKLYQNYPNPFNPETTITFSVAKDSKVSLTVYNSNGQTVANLINGSLKSGFYTSKFDGSKLTSGVYYYSLKVNEKVMTDKMIMLK